MSRISVSIASVEFPPLSGLIITKNIFGISKAEVLCQSNHAGCPWWYDPFASGLEAIAMSTNPVATAKLNFTGYTVSYEKNQYYTFKYIIHQRKDNSKRKV